MREKFFVAVGGYFLAGRVWFKLRLVIKKVCGLRHLKGGGQRWVNY